MYWASRDESFWGNMDAHLRFIFRHIEMAYDCFWNWQQRGKTLALVPLFRQTKEGRQAAEPA